MLDGVPGVSLAGGALCVAAAGIFAYSLLRGARRRDDDWRPDRANAAFMATAAAGIALTFAGLYAA